MALQPRTVHIPAAVGIDEGTRPEHVDFGSRSLAMVNGRQDKRGGYTTRLGFTALAIGLIDGTSPGAAYRMFADRDTVVRITGTPQAEVYSEGAQAWQNLGRVPEAACRLIDVPSMGNTTNLEDVDATNGYIALAWLSATSISVGAAYLAIIDQASGSVVRAPEVVGTSTIASSPLLAVQGNYFVMVRYNSTGTKLEAFYLDTTSRTTINTGWVAFASSLCTDSTSLYALVALPNASTPSIAVLHGNTSGGTNRLTVRTFNVASGVLQSLTIATSSLTPGGIGIGGNSSDTLWCCWSEAGSVLALGLNPSNITAAAKATRGSILIGMAGPLGSGAIGVVAGTTTGAAKIFANDSGTPLVCYFGGVTTVAGVATSLGFQVILPNVRSCRTPFFANGRYYGGFFGGDISNTQANLIVCDWTDVTASSTPFLRPVANPAPGLSSLGLSSQGKFALGTTSGRYVMGMGVKRSGVADGSALCELDFASTSRWQPAAFGNSTYLSGGIASSYDGVRVAETGFLIRPLMPTPTVSGTGITGTFKYVCVYEEVDADGNWHQSGLSAPSPSISPANQTVTITTSPLTISARLSTTSGAARSVRVAFYRTLTGGAAPYYRVGTTINNTTATTVVFVDAIADTALAANAKLYSQPGVPGTAQDKRPPPPFSSIVAYNGMLVGASGSDVWYSGQNVSGEGVWFNPIFQVPVPGDGDITALAVMDGTLFAFKRREVWGLAGDAPADNGASGGLGVPRRMAVDVGCIEARSTCTTALGVFFQSDRGIEILTRAQTVEWIGEGVQDDVASFPICTSATVDPGSCTLIMEMASSQSAGLVTGTGRSLVYDLSLKTWVSVDRRTSSAGTADTPAQGGCMVHSGSGYRYAWLTALAGVEVENNSYLDGGGNYWVQPQWETSWAKLGLQQEQMLWAVMVLFQRWDAAGLQVEIAYDYQPYNPADNRVWTEAETLGQVQLEFRPRPKSQSMKFRVTATQPVTLGTGQGIAFVGLSLNIAVKQGPTTGTPRLDTSLRK